jgi:hypothetical protein
VKTRALLALSAVLASGLSAGAASAAVRKAKPTPPTCLLVKDDAGDASGVSDNDDQLDILSADIASDAKLVTAVIRLAADPAGVDPQAPLSKGYYFAFDVAGLDRPLYMSASVSPTTGNSFSWGTIDPSANGTTRTKAGAATGTIANKEIHITVPVADLASKGKVNPGSKISGLTVDAYWVAGSPGPGVSGGFLEAGDNATGKSYIAGAKSCVTPGK